MSGKPDLDRELERLGRHLPGWARRGLDRVRRPSAFWLRVPVGLALIPAGIVGIFLPVLGFWMVPLGLALLALDVPFMRGPLARLIGLINRKLAPQAG
jgi:hypothetical protein